VVYPIISHWVWSPDGWLAKGFSIDNGTITSGFHDFAGSGVVHATGGIASFVGAALLGPRLYRFDSETGKPQSMPGHSVPHVALGAFILYFTFLAFNGGSQMSISNPGDGLALAIVMVNTILACSCGGTAGLIISWLTSPHWSFLETVNGSLAGTVAICSGCNVVYPWGACIIGAIGAGAYSLLSRLVLRLGVDDPASSIAVHYGGGVVGVLSVAFFDRSRGILLRWDRRAAWTWRCKSWDCWSSRAWSGGLSAAVFGLLHWLGLLRASEEFEIR
uniref:Ammonium_transp domain-containing protein n=1 Tax=Macrostomum lignano TaxID=282301 RepID=A0A1I8HK04_9PLAT